MKNTPMRLRHFIQLVGATSIASCISASPKKQSATQLFASLPKIHQEVYDTLFRHIIAGSSFKKWYLKLLEADAPEDLLQRYRAEGLQVYPASSYKDGRGAMISMGGIDSLTSSRADIIADYVFGPLGAVDGNYHLVKKRGRWIVESFKILTCA